MQNMQSLMRQVQKIQKKMAELQQELAKKTVEATVGGGMVTAVVNGRQELVSIKIDPEVVNPEDIEMLQDLIVAAVNEAIRRSQEMVEQEMAKITGGLKIPGMF
ncbi:YbaB/EbfC family nucleoid-associated protein [Thermodesulfatator autotrophicus]|uniref:Nucleoid-associated protein TH606_06845 n=1 Tax=Thermodesulfatator autotrophicus TaxID=1795632 RepID=A0A177E6D1_9BACT|nr:YbaB/EbfC family nucleoid-associated protein [Thermodesulfatator autotrophicus]OAG27455.1 nucleoid-associated protein [Thermodesulfatator autotrophicus]